MHVYKELENLPIHPYLEEIAAKLKKDPSRALVLTAETAAGKSTAVPVVLTESFSGKVLMLEPRRLAVLAVASRVSEILKDELGGLVGYRMHLDSKISEKTRFEVMTEAVLIRLMQKDPSLDGVSVVVIDEFHERSIYTDLALVFLKECMMLRDDLYLLIMSATMETQKLSDYLNCSVFSVPGRQFPVSMKYHPFTEEMHDKVCSEIKNVLWNEKNTGSILVFLPGIYDIRCVEDLLKQDEEFEVLNVEVLILHSSVPFQEQKKVFEPIKEGKKRVIISSAVAETSITVPDVTVVIDSGFARVNRFDASTGMNHLVTEPESEFSAVQRAGRAGRVKAGTCIRLWAESDVRVADFPPEIKRADLCSLVLECALWGVRKLEQLDFLDVPPLSLWNTSVSFLVNGGCLQKVEDGIAITELGRKVISLGVHPRIALTALTGSDEGIEYAVKYSGCASEKEKNKLYEDLRHRIKSSSYASVFSDERLKKSQVLLAGFFDRLAYHCEGKVYQFPSGRKASLPPEVSSRFSEAQLPRWIVAPEVDSGTNMGHIYSFEEVDVPDWWLESRIEEDELLFYAEKKDGTKSLKKVSRKKYGKIILSETPLKIEKEDSKKAYCVYVREEGIKVLPWNKASLDFFLRAKFYSLHKEPSMNVSEEELLDTLEEWLIPFLISGQCDESTFLNALRYHYDGDLIDKYVPSKIKLENGKEIKLVYEETDREKGPRPVMEIIIQRVFGCFSTPYVCDVPVLFKLLSPARRPLQITDDLAGFWERTWPEICREMKGRYPKHNWDYRVVSE